jgi:hypothetical protein
VSLLVSNRCRTRAPSKTLRRAILRDHPRVGGGDQETVVG